MDLVTVLIVALVVTYLLAGFTIQGLCRMVDEATGWAESRWYYIRVWLLWPLWLLFDGVLFLIDKVKR